MTTDNRTNVKPSISTNNEGGHETGVLFSDAQVEAAAKALEKLPLNLITRSEALDAARAALVAAQGAAPVQPSSTVNEALRFCICSHWLEAHHDRKCLEHHCACVNFEPVLRLDKGKLAEVIKRADVEWQVRELRLDTASKLIHGQYVARAVAEWLRGESRAQASN